MVENCDFYTHSKNNRTVEKQLRIF